MGNQQGKVAAKRVAGPSQYPFMDTEKRSRTDWTAGTWTFTSKYSPQGENLDIFTLARFILKSAFENNFVTEHEIILNQMNS